MFEKHIRNAGGVKMWLLLAKVSESFPLILTTCLHLCYIPPYTAMNCEADLVRHKMFSDKA